MQQESYGKKRIRGASKEQAMLGSASQTGNKIVEILYQFYFIILIKQLVPTEHNLPKHCILFATHYC